MTLLGSLAIVIALVAGTALLGWAWRARTGRTRAASGELIAPESLGEDTRFGTSATLLQFSTDYCTSCRSTRTALASLAAQQRGVAHLEINLTRRPELAGRFHVMQTPTTLVLDERGAVRARVGGAPRMEELRATLAEVTGVGHVVA